MPDYTKCNFHRKLQRQLYHSVESLWYRPRPSLPVLAWLLWPFSYLYQLIMLCRRGIYARLNKRRFRVPIIVVGNLSVGGTGKTPLVIYLATWLKSLGYRPGIIIRGYGANASVPSVVTPLSDAAEVGDEALLIYQKTDCPVMVSPKRVLSAERLISQHDCNVLLSDDGLQHYALVRDIEIAVVDGVRRYGNGFCLPLGPLREPQSRLKQVDYIVCNGLGEKNEYSMRLSPSSVQPLGDQKTVDLSRRSITAVAGIGHPERFFATLRQLGFQFKTKSFPDHYAYKQSDFDFLGTDEIVIMTEKDAVKCQAFADHRFYCLPVDAELPEDFKKNLLARLTLRRVD